MIFDVGQTEVGLSAGYLAERNGQVLGSARIANNVLMGGACECQFLDDRYTLSYLPKRQAESWGKPRVEKTGFPYQIAHNGQPVGDICIRTSPSSLFSRYDYYAMDLGCPYTMYRVGLGKQGLKCPIYDRSVQIALIEKGPVVRDHLDAYHVSALDEDSGTIAFLFALYLDMAMYPGRGQVSSSREVSYVHTTRRALLEKYDPAFTSRVSP